MFRRQLLLPLAVVLAVTAGCSAGVASRADAPSAAAHSLTRGSSDGVTGQDSSRTVFNLRWALLDASDAGTQQLPQEPRGDIDGRSLRSAVRFAAMVTTFSPDARTITFDVLSPHYVADQGTTFVNRHRHLQTRPLASTHISVLLLRYDDRRPVLAQPIAPPGAEGSDVEPLTLDEFLSAARRDPTLLSQDTYYWLYLDHSGRVTMLTEDPGV